MFQISKVPVNAKGEYQCKLPTQECVFLPEISNMRIENSDVVVFFQYFQSDSSSVPTAATVKVINKPAISNNSIGSAVKKMLIKSEPPQLTNFTTANLSKTNIGSSVPMQTETIETKMVQIPLPDYAELVTQLKELKERVATLEAHCEKCTGFIRSKSTSQH